MYNQSQIGSRCHLEAYSLPLWVITEYAIFWSPPQWRGQMQPNEGWGVKSQVRSPVKSRVKWRPTVQLSERSSHVPESYPEEVRLLRLKSTYQLLYIFCKTISGRHRWLVLQFGGIKHRGNRWVHWTGKTDIIQQVNLRLKQGNYLGVTKQSVTQ